MSAVPHPMTEWAEANKPTPSSVILYPSRIAMSIRAWLKLPPIPLIYADRGELMVGALKVQRADAAIQVMQGKMSLEDFQQRFPFPNQPGVQR